MWTRTGGKNATSYRSTERNVPLIQRFELTNQASECIFALCLKFGFRNGKLGLKRISWMMSEMKANPPSALVDFHVWFF